MLDTGTLTGRLYATEGLTGRLTTTSSITGTITRFDGGYSPYTGAYEVDPDFTGTTLVTTNRYMTDDVTVNPIQVESVSNPAGGRTVYIGGVINYG